MLYRLFALLLVLLLACPLSAPAEVDAAASPLYVRKVENLPEDFIFGMDASSVLAEEASGVVYRDAEGNPADVFQVLADAGVTHIRVRVWNDPFDSQGHGYGGGNCDIHTAVEIGRRATACGLGLIVDFHYSDFWADPGKQMVPKAWAGMTIEQMAADTAAVMDALGLRDAAVYGVSQGGMIAQALTLARPDLVGCLVLCSTAAHVSEAAASVLGGWVRSAAAGDCEGLMAQFAEHVYSPAYREKYAGAFRVLAGLVTDEEREAFVHLVADAGGFDVRARLHEIKCPVLVIGAGKDRIFGGAASEAIAAATGGTLGRYPDGAHGVYDEDPDVLVRIRAFLYAH